MCSRGWVGCGQCVLDGGGNDGFMSVAPRVPAAGSVDSLISGMMPSLCS